MQCHKTPAKTCPGPTGATCIYFCYKTNVWKSLCVSVVFSHQFGVPHHEATKEAIGRPSTSIHLHQPCHPCIWEVEEPCPCGDRRIHKTMERGAPPFANTRPPRKWVGLGLIFLISNGFVQISSRFFRGVYTVFGWFPYVIDHGWCVDVFVPFSKTSTFNSCIFQAPCWFSSCPSCWSQLFMWFYEWSNVPWKRHKLIALKTCKHMQTQVLIANLSLCSSNELKKMKRALFDSLSVAMHPPFSYNVYNHFHPCNFFTYVTSTNLKK